MTITVLPTLSLQMPCYARPDSLVVLMLKDRAETPAGDHDIAAQPISWCCRLVRQAVCSIWPELAS